MSADLHRWWIAAANAWGASLPTGDESDKVEVEVNGVRQGTNALTLDRRAGGPFDPLTNTAAVGGLALPLNVEQSADDLFVAAAHRRRILRLDPVTRELRSWIGLEPLGRPSAVSPQIVLTHTRDLLIVAEHGRSRILAIHTGAHIVLDSASVPARILDMSGTGTGDVLILGRTSAGAALWRWRPGADAPVRLGTIPNATPDVEPVRLLRDARGRTYVFETAHARMLELPLDNAVWLPFDTVTDRFAPLPVVIETHTDGTWRMRVPPAETKQPFPWPAPFKWRAYDAEGRLLELQPDAPVGPPPFRADGTIQIGPLDGRLPRMTWDRIEIEIDDLSAATAIEVRTRTAETMDADAAFVEWSAPAHRLMQSHDAGSHTIDVAVLSSPARYLWIELRLLGGSATPAIRSITAIYPRAGLIDYLPLVFREADQDSRFLERFVTALERAWDPLENSVSDFDRELRPDTASAPMLNYLGGWLDQPMDFDWTVAARRHAVKHSAKYLQQRGTPAAVQSALRLYIANRWNLVPESLGQTPFLWEHFRSRVPLHAGEGAEGHASGVLFGAEVLNRLRLGSSELGAGTLRDYGSPETDHVMVDARRFSVFVPRALVPSADEIRGLRNVLEHEQPADAYGELIFVEPRMRIGVQATLGVDSILGVYPKARLAQSADESDDAPAARLDYDCMLADVEPGPRPGTPSVGDQSSAIPFRLT